MSKLDRTVNQIQKAAFSRPWDGEDSGPLPTGSVKGGWIFGLSLNL